MHKNLWLLVVCALLSACYCKCVPSTPATPQEIPAAQLVTSETNEPAAKMPVSSRPLVSAPQRDSVSASTKENVTVKKQTMPTPTAQSAQSEDPAEQIKKLIAQARENQTLSNPPADTPIFKKESILPLEGRLLSPLAYEPIFKDNTHAPWSNESLKFGIYYSFVKAGTAYIKTRGLTNLNGKTAYLIQTTAFSAPVIDSVFKVRDINYSWLDVNTLHSLGYSQSVREGNYQRDEWVTFDNENNRFYGEIKKKEDPKIIAGPLDIEVLDILSSLYYVRTQPLEAGKDITFDIINREKQYPLVVKVIGKETVKTDAGKFSCWVVEPQFRGEGIFVAKGKSLKVWLTDDKYRMPVKMSVEVFIGSVYAELLEYQRN